eukprot:122399-Pyramimonas_sp.AAC.1
MKGIGMGMGLERDRPNDADPRSLSPGAGARPPVPSRLSTASRRLERSPGTTARECSGPAPPARGQQMYTATASLALHPSPTRDGRQRRGRGGMGAW